MKMFKKLMAVVLTGALAVSMLTGCSLSEMAKAKALEKALNSGNAQGSTKTVEYDHKTDLDSKAQKVYEEKFNSDKTTIAEVKNLTKFTPKGSSTAYAYVVVEAPSKAADLKKSSEWSAKTLHETILGSIAKNGKNGSALAKPVDVKYFVQNKADKNDTKAEVSFGVKIYKNETANKYYAIVVVKLVDSTATV